MQVIQKLTQKNNGERLNKNNRHMQENSKVQLTVAA